MPTIRLTQAAVEKLTPPKSGRAEFFDTHLPGFGLRIADSGHKAWVVFYRIGGRAATVYDRHARNTPEGRPRTRAGKGDPAGRGARH